MRSELRTFERHSIKKISKVPFMEPSPKLKTTYGCDPKPILKKISFFSKCSLDTYSISFYICARPWGYSSVGRAPAWHAGGQEFDSP